MNVAKLIKTLRAITNNLRPVMLDSFGFSAAIEELIEQWNKVQLTTNFTLVNSFTKDINDNIAIGCYRIIQEGLTNSIKHAHANNVDIEITIKQDIVASVTYKTQTLLQIKITDDGVGFRNTEQTTGLGLISMRERTKALMGKFTITTTPSIGTMLVITIPI